MSEVLDQIMIRAVKEVFENMSFMEVLIAVEQEIKDEEVLAVKQEVLDPVRGEFHLVLPRRLAAKIAEILFTKPSDEMYEQQLADLATELLNTLVGKLLNSYLASDKIYKVGLPALEEAGPEVREAWSHKWYFTIENMVFLFAVADDLVE
jgi:hypothetical protein